MQKYLEEFYHGNISPNEGTFPRDPTYKPKGAKVCQLEELLLIDLPEEKKEIYEKFQLACIDRDVIENAQIYIDGFKLGARLMLEVMLDDDTP